jgi:hypothetical protein
LYKIQGNFFCAGGIANAARRQRLMGDKTADAARSSALVSVLTLIQLLTGEASGEMGIGEQANRKLP